MRQIRRVDLVWHGEEVAQYEKLKSDAAKLGVEIAQFVKEVLAEALKSLRTAKVAAAFAMARS